MLLLMDVGNTSTTYGLFDGKRFRTQGHIASLDVPKFVRDTLKNGSISPVDSALITSVFPQISRRVKKILKGRLNGEIGVVGENVKVSIKHKYKYINKLGKDRLVNIYGALWFYKPPLLILDFGTALTCDYVAKSGIFMGGLIIPGPEISLKALYEKTSQLPKVSFPKKDYPLAGRDTDSGMKAGILYAYGAMTDGLIDRFQSKYGSCAVVLTGGLSHIISLYTRRVHILDPLLTLKSLARIYKEQVAKKPA